MEDTAAAETPLEPVQLPAAGGLSADFCLQLERSMLKATWAGVAATQQVLTPQVMQSIVMGVAPILEKEPTLIEIQPAALQQQVTVVGDTHGQFHDLCRLFELYGHPSADKVYIFNGDYVDRGAWGAETLLLLLAWKWALPHNVYLLRGNHETNTITRIYGFYAELKAKYGAASKGLFTCIRRLFAHLPLAALVQDSTLILHGGLFRAPPKNGKGSKRRRASGVQALTLGSLDDLRKATKGGQDPDPERSSKNFIASDVMWSDPVNAPGLRPNDARGCGTVYGPDVTQSFLADNGLRLIIRSHEGPDARDKRQEGDRMPSVDSGYAVDHDTPIGKLVTLFSAPDYPQFMADGEERYHNRAAVLHLTGPDYATPAVDSFDAVLPRPHAESYYDLPSWTDDEDELAEEQQQPAGSTDGSVAAEAAEVEAHDTGAADSRAARAAVTGPQLPRSSDAAAGAAQATTGINAPVLDVEAETAATAAAAAAPIQQQDTSAGDLPNSLHASLQGGNGSQQQPEQQQVELLRTEKASEPGTKSDNALANRQQQRQEDKPQPLARVDELQQQQQQRQQQGVAEQLQESAAAAVAGSSEAHSGSGVADAAAADADGQPTPVRPVKRHKADPGAAE